MFFGAVVTQPAVSAEMTSSSSGISVRKLLRPSVRELGDFRVDAGASLLCMNDLFILLDLGLRHIRSGGFLRQLPACQVAADPAGEPPDNAFEDGSEDRAHGITQRAAWQSG